jgi:preprotein translocase subunit SecB
MLASAGIFPGLSAQKKKGLWQRAAAKSKDQGSEAGGATTGNGKPPVLNVLNQYLKDLSFESPGAPKSLQVREKAPSINIGVNVNANPLTDTEFDVVLSLNAKAQMDKDVLFNVELMYGGIFHVENFPQEHMLPILFIECPRLLFPFARQIIADATRNGGFPPLMLDPIDFVQMFQQKIAEDQARAKVQAANN